ncbi:hypothetical protein ABBQ38_013008 [Trebouxia sp. C0009 RCD-2024]
MSGQVVCIIHQNVQSNANALNINKLVSAGCKVRFSTNTVPDLIMSRSGTTAAFLLVVNSSDLQMESDTWNRYLDSLTIICFPPGTDLCTRTVDLFETLATPENGLAGQRQQAVMSSSAVNQVLTSIPGLPLQEHQADSLRMMGSLQMLASSSVEDVLDNTDLDQSQ